MNSKYKNTSSVDFLTPFLVVDFLKKIGIDNNLTNNLTSEVLYLL